jgi:hypothetical protein
MYIMTRNPLAHALQILSPNLKFIVRRFSFQPSGGLGPFSGKAKL